MRELERDTPRSATQEPAHPPIVVIGRGRVGGALALAAENSGVDVALAGRDGLAEAAAGSSLALLCVPDAEIEAAAEALAAAAPHLRFAGHTSGATRLEALQPLAAAGVGTFSLHPLQTVPDPRASVAGAPAAVAGATPAAAEAARQLADQLGMQPFDVPEEARAAYHAAASMASNFLIALEQSAVELLDRAGIPDSRDLLAPLVMQTVANWSLHGGAALTGPIARGDEETVERHLAALRDVAPELTPMYEALAARTRSVAGTGGGDA